MHIKSIINQSNLEIEIGLTWNWFNVQNQISNQNLIKSNQNKNQIKIKYQINHAPIDQNSFGEM